MWLTSAAFRELRSCEPVGMPPTKAFDDAYRQGLMAFRKDAPPPVRDAEHGEDGPLHGAVALALDHITTAAGLADWVERQRI
jgi:hypothetical protein